MDEDYMCPNCVTPWKCNGPHLMENDMNLITITEDLDYYWPDDIWGDAYHMYVKDSKGNTQTYGPFDTVYEALHYYITGVLGDTLIFNVSVTGDKDV